MTIEVEVLNIRIESSVFPGENFLVYRVTGREKISQLFSFEVDITCEGKEGIDIVAAAGTEIDIVFERARTEIRRIHGVVAEVHDLLTRLRERRTYRLRIAPRAYRLALVETSEVTLTTTVPDLIKKKFALVGLGGDVEMQLLGSYPTQEFIAQHQEADLSFVSRLAEHLGISYYFDHKSGKDKIVFTDNTDGFERAPEPAEFNVIGQERDVYELEARAQLIPSVFVVRDYNYRQPLLDLTSEHAIPTGYAGGVIEFGDHYKTPDEGKVLAQIRSEERQAKQLVYQGRSNICTLAAGTRFTLEDHPQLGSLELLAIEVDHSVNIPGEIEGRTHPPQHYVNTFRAVPAKQTYRPPRVTKKPRVTGVVTGIIDAGPGGSSDYAQIDEQGRYMVRLMFDTTPSGGTVSRPIRMLQNHAGANYGTHFPLKPGIEVLVTFVNGDPDRPVIVGAVPNPLTPSPVSGANRTTHRIKTKEGIVFDLVDE